MAYETNNSQAIQEAYRDLYGHDIQTPEFAGEQKLRAAIEGRRDALNNPVSDEVGMAIAGQAGLRALGHSQDQINDAIRRGHSGEMYQRDAMPMINQNAIRRGSGGSPVYTEGAQAAINRGWSDAASLETPGVPAQPASQQQLVNQQVPGAERMRGYEERTPYEAEREAARMLSGEGYAEKSVDVTQMKPSELGLTVKAHAKLVDELKSGRFQKNDEVYKRGVLSALGKKSREEQDKMLSMIEGSSGAGTDMYGDIIKMQQMQEDADSMQFGKGYEHDLGAAFEAYKRNGNAEDLLLNAHRIATYYNEDPRNVMAMFGNFTKPRGGTRRGETNTYGAVGFGGRVVSLTDSEKRTIDKLAASSENAGEFTKKLYKALPGLAGKVGRGNASRWASSVYREGLTPQDAPDAMTEAKIAKEMTRVLGDLSPDEIREDPKLKNFIKQYGYRIVPKKDPGVLSGVGIGSRYMIIDRKGNPLSPTQIARQIEEGDWASGSF
jgi:hypothetical protein